MPNARLQTSDFNPIERNQLANHITSNVLSKIAKTLYGSNFFEVCSVKKI